MFQGDVLRLAQLTDAHLGPLPPFWPWHWNAKRVLGFINFRTKRRSFNDPSLVQALVRDLKQQEFDHLVVTGDLANIGMPSELERGERWLNDLGPADAVTAIPGNHDIYCPLWRDRGVERWRNYMQPRGDVDLLPGVPSPLGTGFPFVRILEKFALICLNSAVPTAPGVASGTLGAGQLERFAEQAKALHAAGLSRIVLVHHAPLPEHGRRGLTDADAFDQTLREVGAELVLHGHNHRHMISWRDAPTGAFPIVGAGATGEGRYNIYRIERLDDGRCRTELIERSGSRPELAFAESRRLLIDPVSGERDIVL